MGYAICSENRSKISLWRQIIKFELNELTFNGKHLACDWAGEALYCSEPIPFEKSATNFTEKWLETEAPKNAYSKKPIQ